MVKGRVTSVLFLGQYGHSGPPLGIVRRLCAPANVLLTRLVVHVQLLALQEVPADLRDLLELVRGLDGLVRADVDDVIFPRAPSERSREVVEITDVSLP
jgi:hypothetical protein